MLAMAENPEVLRNKIKNDLEYLDMEELRKLYQTIASMAAAKASKLADREWIEKDISREKIKEEVRKYRASNK